MSLFAHLPDYRGCEACTTCVDCGRRFCRDDTPSPGEERGICPACFEWSVPIVEQIAAMEEALADGLPAYDESADTSLSPKTSPCPYCNDTGWVESTNYYTHEVTRTPCWSSINHSDKDAS